MELSQTKRQKFEQGLWNNQINVRDFIQLNLTPYEGDAGFLEGPTEATKELWEICLATMLQERENNGCLDIDTENISTITSHGPGYIKKDLEKIVGLQTDALLKRAMKPFGGIRVVEGAVKERGMQVAHRVKEIFEYAKDHNSAVFDAYDPVVSNLVGHTLMI